MVAIDFRQRVVRCLELYLLQQTDFKLQGDAYELMLFVPVNYYSFNNRIGVVVSARQLNSKSEKEAVLGLLHMLKRFLSAEEYALVFTVNVIHTDSPLVQRLNAARPFQRTGDVEYDVSLTDRDGEPQPATMIRSSVLPNLVVGQKRSIKLFSGGVIAGQVLSIDEEYQLHIDENLAGWTGRTVTCKFVDIESVHLFVGQ